jgi:S-adenosylmethionine hydrolase
VRTFADVDAAELLVYQDSYRRLAVAVRNGSAAERLALAADGEVRIRASR